jgi:hypothetical protein
MVLAVAVFTVLAILYGSTQQDCIVLMIYIVSSALSIIDVLTMEFCVRDDVMVVFCTL